MDATQTPVPTFPRVSRYTHTYDRPTKRLGGRPRMKRGTQLKHPNMYVQWEQFTQVIVPDPISDKIPVKYPMDIAQERSMGKRLCPSFRASTGPALAFGEPPLTLQRLQAQNFEAFITAIRV